MVGRRLLTTRWHAPLFAICALLFGLPISWQNLIGGFHALGTLMAVGIMILPAAAARFWVGDIVPIILVAVLIAFAGSLSGLLMSYYVNLPAGPAIVLTLGAFYIASMAIGPLGPLLSRLRPRWHFAR